MANTSQFTMYDGIVMRAHRSGMFISATCRHKRWAGVSRVNESVVELGKIVLKGVAEGDW